jgi:hypothetical protein
MLIFPVLLIFLLFPTGRPPTPRWRWLIYLAVGMIVTLTVLSSISQTMAPMDEGFNWTVKNPIGLLPGSLFDQYFLIPWSMGLVVLTIGCVLALIVRFRRAGLVEREQIKWFLYAGGIFGLVYIAGLPFVSTFEASGTLWDFTFLLSLMFIPAAIAIAILRYRLFDIDIIIRKTLVYALLTGLLALIYLGSILITQAVFGFFFGEQTTLGIVISTLTITALFAPLRRRVQSFIDRRFYRQKYDAEKLLSAFARKARDETNFEALTGDLMVVVRETVQPEKVSIWLSDHKLT